MPVLRLLAGEARWRLLTPASYPGTSMMRIARGFDPIVADELDDFAFDFGPRLALLGAPSETVAGVAWNCSVDVGSGGADPAAATRIIGPARVVGTVVVQRVGTMLPGVGYLLEAVVETAPSGRTLSLSAGVDCLPP